MRGRESITRLLRPMCIGIGLPGVLFVYGLALGPANVAAELPVGLCEDPSDIHYGGRLPIEGHAYDVIVPVGRGYVVGTSRGVVELDRCRQRRVGGCLDDGGAHQLRHVPGSDVVTYVRGDGSLAGCHLDSGGAARNRASSPPVTRARLSARIHDGRAYARFANRKARRLRTSSEALSAATFGDRWVAVADRFGLTVFSMPEGIAMHHRLGGGAPTYSVAFDVENGRMLTALGPGVLRIELLPEAMLRTR